ncbi:hypothetical protein [Mycolicibacterium alvei]|uniref:Uncharacterized protein n=1 Tax=Mycolicibacterium alvei TaxID=67081 RepID=A0A6N4V2P1_9MYCO|nr:hypothetical protein [Mycolicibacterium alvei]MCV6998827.1 hypothetical protein [Mycolicibacterium alvei]BBX30403.1 hypothetical protein MALV_55280 [Mycolicibacterium alvei]
MANPSNSDDELSRLYGSYATCIRPVMTKTSDNRWMAQYPGVDWHVTADTEAAAGEELLNEALRRIDAGEPDAQPPHDLLERHLTHPIPGVYALDLDLFLYLRSHAGVAQTQLAFEEAERRRAAGKSYTKGDYLAEHGES